MFPNPIFLGITWYEILFFIGIIAALVVYRIYTDYRKIPAKVSNFYLTLAVLSICAGYLSAIFFQAVYDYIQSGVFDLHSGMTFLGGLTGGVAVFLLGYRFLSQPEDRKYFRLMLNVAPCSILIAHFFGRLGCFTAGCCYGKETHSLFGVVFPNSYTGGVPVHPTQLYEAFFLLIAFIAVSYLYFKDFQITLPVYVISYGIFRFFIEFLRGDERGQLIPGLSPSQALSLAMIILGMVLLIPYFLKHKPARSPYLFQNPII